MNSIFRTDHGAADRLCVALRGREANGDVDLRSGRNATAPIHLVLRPSTTAMHENDEREGGSMFQDVAIGSNGISKFVVRGNTLVINYVDETDNGRYSCQVFNDYDRRGQRAEYQLSVIGRIEGGKFKNSSFRLCCFSSTTFVSDRPDQNQFG